jgi:8-amino-7-oxononanoate synthase
MDRLHSDLQKLSDAGRLRKLAPTGGIDFTSNDYLGLKQHPALRETAVAALENNIDIGAGGSRLLRGNHPAFESLEANAAKFFNAERALYFSSGFLANYALITTLPARADVILFDSLIHASLRDGVQANNARHFRIPHNDLDAYEAALSQHTGPGHDCWVVVESAYSMDGDLAPLRELEKLCEKFGAWLVIDEAHATGIFGAQGRGLAETIKYERAIVVHTCGKALGVAGALVCASKNAIDTLINRARPFIYSTAPMPLQAVLVEKALELCAAEEWRREKLWKLCAVTRQAFGFTSPSAIYPYIIGPDQAAMDAAEALQKQGFDVRAVRPPTVPEGTARLRIAINATLEEKNILALGEALRAIPVKAAA